MTERFDPAEGFTTYHYQRLAEGEPLTLGHLRRMVKVADVANEVAGAPKMSDDMVVRDIFGPSGERYVGIFE